MRANQFACLATLPCSLLVFNFILTTILTSLPAVVAKEETSEEPRNSLAKPRLSTPLECARECRDGEPPKICYWKFNLENYAVLGRACLYCHPNNNNQLNNTCQCITADGVERMILSVNRMLPGPSIQVCENDTIVVDVTNAMEGMDVTIHWHGVFQRHSPFYDGVPMITQCPITQGNSFRYQFLAANSGTHFWHAHTGLQKMDGIHGSLIIREPRSGDPSSKLYDEDLPEHVMLVADWFHFHSIDRLPGRLHEPKGQSADSVLINGKGRYRDPTTNVWTTTPYEVFTVRRGKRYRFRFINSFCTVCPAQLIIQGHSMTLIATDGVAIEPVTVNAIITYPGERYDFVIDAKNTEKSYWIQLRALGECADFDVQQHAILQYAGKPKLPTSLPPSYRQHLPIVKVLAPLDGRCDKHRPDAICVSQLKTAVPVDKGILLEKPCAKFYFAFNFTFWQSGRLFEPGTFQTHMQPNGSAPITAIVNNVSFASPTSPPLTQFDDIPEDQWCSQNDPPVTDGGIRNCVQKVDVPLNCDVEIIMLDGMGAANLTHPIHLHGHAFNVIGMGHSPNPNMKRMSLEHALELDAKKQLIRNMDQPPFKDTIAVPTGGYTIVRVRANNPGWWFMHCHFLYHIVIGMSLVLHVGEPKDLPPIPPNFPKCGDYYPPIGYQHLHKEELEDC